MIIFSDEILWLQLPKERLIFLKDLCLMCKTTPDRVGTIFIFRVFTFIYIIFNYKIYLKNKCAYFVIYVCHYTLIYQHIHIYYLTHILCPFPSVIIGCHGEPVFSKNIDLRNKKICFVATDRIVCSCMSCLV